MERSVAIRKLGKLLGKSLGYRVDSKAPTQEEREVAQSQLPAACAERDKVKEKRDARYKEILAADLEYQTLLTEHRAARERVEKLSSIARHYKITVGKSNGLFFHVMAEGDSWEEVIDKLMREKQTA